MVFRAEVIGITPRKGSFFMGNGVEQDNRQKQESLATVHSFDAYKQKKLQKEHVGSAAFNLEQEQSYTDIELRDDIVSYLGEYRLNVPKYEYEYVIGIDPANPNEGAGICEPNRRELMRVKSKRILVERSGKGLPTHREEAEDFALSLIDEKMDQAQAGDTLLWGSPPGPKEEGYGDYGFVFYGRVFEGKDLLGKDEKRVAMKAIRVEKPMLLQYNSFFNEFVESPVDFKNVDQFLASPFVLSESIPEKIVDSALKKHFAFEVNNEDQEIFKKVIEEMNPLIDQFIIKCKTGSGSEKLQAFYALENYSLSLRDKYKTKFESNGKVVFIDDYQNKNILFQDIVEDYGHKPPVVSGSCGSTESESIVESLKSNMAMKRLEALMKALGIEIDGFECPKCMRAAVGPIGDTCPNCNITKQEFARMSGGEVCD